MAAKKRATRGADAPRTNSEKVTSAARTILKRAQKATKAIKRFVREAAEKSMEDAPPKKRANKAAPAKKRAGKAAPAKKGAVKSAPAKKRAAKSARRPGKGA
jgi:hypothetical protein